MTSASGFLAVGDVAWLAGEPNGWPMRVGWDDGRYRIELTVSSVESRDDWNEDGLVALIYALAGEQQD